MGLDEEPDHDHPRADGPLPPDDRIWRHPSELGPDQGRSPDRAGHGGKKTLPSSRAPLSVGALAGACLAGAVVAFGAMWLTRPTRVEQVPERQALATASSLAAPMTISAGTTGVLTTDLSPQVALLQVERAGEWVSGSALWTDSQGTLVTSAAAIRGASSIMVVGADGRRQPARMVGLDPVTAIAALAVDHTAGGPLSISPIEPRAGSSVALVGAPGTSSATGKAEASVASVIIRLSSHRNSVDGYLVHDLIQLDRPVPADTSGGALVDSRGRLIGLVLGNSTEQDLGAVIRASTVMQVANDLRDHGRVERGTLGVRAVDLSPAQGLLLKVPGGAVLTQVTPSSPAADAGLAVGDIVVAIDALPVDDASDLVIILGRHDGGDRVTLHLSRDGKPATAIVTLGPNG